MKEIFVTYSDRTKLNEFISILESEFGFTARGGDISDGEYDMVRLYEHFGNVCYHPHISEYFDIKNLWCYNLDIYTPDKLVNIIQEHLNINEFEDGEWVALDNCEDGETWITRYGENYEYTNGTSWDNYKEPMKASGRKATPAEIHMCIDKEFNRQARVFLHDFKDSIETSQITFNFKVKKQ